jgi:hypothetical protein
MTREREKGKTGDDQRQSRKREDERERSGSVRKILEVLVRYKEGVLKLMVNLVPAVRHVVRPEAALETA